jgi:hypothetical protein
MATGKLTRIWDYHFCRSYQISNGEVRIKVSQCGKPLIYAGQQIPMLTKCWCMFPKMSHGETGSTVMPLRLEKRRSFRHNESCSADTFWLHWMRYFSLNFSSVVRLRTGYNTQSWGTTRNPPPSPGKRASPKFLIFSASLTLDTNNLVLNSQKPSSESYAPLWRHMALWAMVHVVCPCKGLQLRQETR